MSPRPPTLLRHWCIGSFAFSCTQRLRAFYGSTFAFTAQAGFLVQQLLRQTTRFLHGSFFLVVLILNSCCLRVHARIWELSYCVRANNLLYCRIMARAKHRLSSFCFAASWNPSTILKWWERYDSVASAWQLKISGWFVVSQDQLPYKD